MGLRHCRHTACEGQLKLSILAYGKAGHGPEQALIERYVQRIRWPVTITELPARGSLPPAAAGSRSIALDEHGQALPSMAFATQLGKWRDEGVREVRFLLGPADGHAKSVLAAADLRLAFGPATWPHLLVRAMLAEQLYRAWAILEGHPYHRGD